jgi:hypothetical protein
MLGEFYAYAPNWNGGVRVAAGDVDGDGRAEIITGAGPGGGPHVRVFNTASGQLFPGLGGNFYAFAETFNGGVFVAAGDVDGDGRAEIIAGAGHGGSPQVRVVRASDGQEVANFVAFAPQFAGGVRVGTIDFNGDRRAEIVLASGVGTAPLVRVTDFRGQNQFAAFSASGSSAGIFAAAPRPAPAAVTGSSATATQAVFSTWNNTPTDSVADDLVSATLSSSSQEAQARRRAALLALL